MPLQRLPESIQRLPDDRPQGLTLEAVNPRPRGRKWMRTRERIQQRDGSLCVDCGLLWVAELDQVDHDVPRETGGSDDDANLRLRCDGCHKIKTEAEEAERRNRR